MIEIQLTERQFNELPEYSTTLPTGTTIGKKWKRKTENGWLHGEYAEEPDKENYPNQVKIIWSKIYVIASTEPCQHKRLKHSNTPFFTSTCRDCGMSHTGKSYYDNLRFFGRKWMSKQQDQKLEIERLQNRINGALEYLKVGQCTHIRQSTKSISTMPLQYWKDQMMKIR